MVVRFSKVNDCLYRGGKPSTKQELLILKNVWGVDKIVSLDLLSGKNINKTCVNLGLDHVICPISHHNVENQDELDRITNNLDRLFDDDCVTFVHCVHGRDRTGFAVALYRMIREGWSFKYALDEALSFGFGDGLSNKEKNAWILYLRDKEDNNDTDDFAFNTNEATHSFSNIVPPIDDNLNDDTNDLMAQVGINQRTNPMFVGSGPIEPLGILPSFNNIIPSSDINNSNDRKIKRKKRMEDMNELMANVGLNQNSSPILRGIGPIEPCGVLPFGNLYY